MKWEERWSFDEKTFKPKTVKVRNRRERYGDKRIMWDGGGGKTYFEGETMFASEEDASEAGIRAAKTAVVRAESSSDLCREGIVRANKQIEDNAAEVARIKKILVKLEVAP